MTESCPVKLFVAATPISGPQFRVKEQSLIRANDEVGTFTIESIFAPVCLADFTECKTSAVSPLWEIAITAELSSNGPSVYSNSLDIIVSDLILAYLPSISFRIKAE